MGPSEGRCFRRCRRSRGRGDAGVAADKAGAVKGEATAASEREAESNPFLRATGFATPGVTLRSDSLFAEKDEVSGWSRLSVMIPVLMQHAPILRHEHVAVS